MAVDKLKYAIGNSSSTTLGSSVADSDTTMTITSDTNFAAKDGEGMILIDEGAATEEFAYSTGKSGTTLTTPLANRGLEGGSAQAHDASATVKGIITATMWNDLVDSLVNVLSKSTGAVDTTKVVTLTGTQTLTNKTLTSPTINTPTITSPVLTTPKINDTSSDHQYVFAGSELTADRTVTLPLLTGNDDFVFEDHIQTLTNKTHVQRVATYSPVGAGTTTIDLTTGNIHTVTMPAATQTLAISNEVVGQCFIVEINNVTSQGALTWFTTIRWDSGTAPTLTGTNGKRDVFGFRVTGTDTYDGFIVGQNL